MSENKKSITQLLNQVETISKTYDLVAKSTGENFNLFRILGMETAEVKTHSRFLAELLNPKGSHLQGDVFLKLFIDYLNNLKLIEENNEIELKPEQSNVQIEKYIGKKTENEGGRLDINISDNQGNIICIENKINAGEQDKQMLRYANFGEKFKKSHLFFLTLWGNESLTKDDKVVYPISYKTHIIEWLELCKKEAVNLPILRESIGQYINLIKKLTHQTTNKDMEAKMQELILKNIEESKIIRDNYDKAVISLSNKVIDDVINMIDKKIDLSNWDIQKYSIKSDKERGAISLKPKNHKDIWTITIENFNSIRNEKIRIGVRAEGGSENFINYLNMNNLDKNNFYGWWNDYIILDSYKENIEILFTNQDLVNKLMDINEYNNFIKFLSEKILKYYEEIGSELFKMLNP